MSTQEEKRSPVRGGLTVAWLLAAPVRSFDSKKDGNRRTVIELRDPTRLGNSLVVFLDGDAGKLASVQPSTVVTLHVEEVRSGQGRGELVATATREAVERAFGVTGGAS
jgi:hypothetical protein